MPKAAVPSDPLSALIQRLYSQIETPAQQQARVNSEVNAQMAAQQQMLDNEYARQRNDALMMQQAMSQAGAAAASMSSDLFGQVGGEYNQAAKEISGLSHGLTGGISADTMGTVKGINKGLSNVGGGKVQVGGQGGVGGPAQAGVMDYLGGTLPAQTFTGFGQADQFGLAGLISAQNQKATEEANAGLMSAMHDINDSRAKAMDALVAGRADLAHTYLTDAQNSQVKYISLVQGLMAQKTAQATAAQNAAYKGAQLGLSTQRVGLQAASVAQGADRVKVSLASLNARIANQNMSQTLAQAREQRLAGNTAFQQKATMLKIQASALQNELSNGRIDVALSKAHKVIVDHLGKPILGWDGKPIPSSTLATLKTPKTITPGQMSTIMQKANALIPQLFYGVLSSTGKPGGKLIAANLLPTFKQNDPSTWGRNPASYVDATKQLTRMGVKRPQALTMLNDFYARGSDGRPWLSAAERSQAVQRFGSTRVDQLLIQANALIKQNTTQSIAQAEQLVESLLPPAPLKAGGPTGPLLPPG